MIIPSRRAALRGVASLIAAPRSCGDHCRRALSRALGLTLSHYDARGHLVVARRIVDSLTPGWQQIGAVWLPLPHLLNALPVQIDRVLSDRRVGGRDLDRVVCARRRRDRLDRRRAHRIAVARPRPRRSCSCVNPNVLYLQSTPMTEPLLLGLTLAAVAMLVEWCVGGGSGS